MEGAWALDWNGAVGRLSGATSMYVLGRGLGLAVAQESALKFKETCGIHAEGISAAEVRHGPMALVRAGFPVFVYGQNDETLAGIEEAHLAGVVHAAVGKASMSAEQLRDNVVALLTTLLRLKPSTAKGTYLRGVALSSTMGPGIRLDPNDLIRLAEA